MPPGNFKVKIFDSKLNIVKSLYNLLILKNKVLEIKF